MNPTDLPMRHPNPEFQPKNGPWREQCDVLSALSSPLDLVQEFKNFRSSSDPSRFLYFQQGSWFDFAREVCDELRNGFSDGKSSLEVPIDGVLYIFDFLRMLMVNSENHTVNSIAWIDDTGKCFFPRVALDGSFRPKTVVVDSSDEDSDSSSSSNSRKRKRDTQDNILEECSDESPDVSYESIGTSVPEKGNYNNLQGPVWENIQKLDKEDKFYKVVEKLFLTGMERSSVASMPVEITAVHKCMPVGPARSLRFKVFQSLAQEMKSLRGQSSVRFGWYGANLEDLESSLQFGFGAMNNGLLGSQAHGVGVHLTSAYFPYDSAMMTQEDDEGERHLLLCRVIVGQPEQVEAGSSQAHPSSAEYESGVDRLNNPKWLIIWGNHMNTHILPEYLVSFKISKSNKTSLRPNMQRVKKQNVRHDPNNLQYHFPKMISEMKRSLNPSCIQAIQNSYNQWVEGKMKKEAFIKFLRTSAGEELLTKIIRKIRGH